MQEASLEDGILTCLLNELRRGAQSSKIGDFTSLSGPDGFSEEGQEAVRLINEIVSNSQRFAECDLLKYKTISNSIGIAYWNMDIVEGNPLDLNNGFTWSSGLRKMLGYPLDNTILESFSGLLAIMHPDDKETTFEAFAEHVVSNAHQVPFEMEARIKSFTGEYRDIHTFCVIHCDEDGTPLRVIGAVEDVTDLKHLQAQMLEADKQLEDQSYWYKSVLDGIPLMISVIDTNMNLVYSNIPEEHASKVVHESLKGHPCSVWNFPLCDGDECCIVRVKKGERQTFFKHEGISYQVDAEIIRDAKGEPISYLLVIQDITDVENAARRQADLENEAKSLFVANISHEMRTPLNAVLGLSELLLESQGFSQENEMYLEKIYNAGSTLLSIINDILDISKIAAGKLELNQQKYNVADMLNDTIAQNILLIDSKPVRFNLDVNEQTPLYLFGDELRVKQIISNLLSNAFKYTERGKTELHLDFEQEGNSVWLALRVNDTGIGIRKRDLERIFTDYTRFDEASNRKTDGTGLGLSITKDLIELMDGTVNVESEFGKGSAFIVRIKQQYVDETIIGREIVTKLRNFSYVTSKRYHGTQINRVSLPHARVLVVDDNLTNLEIAKGFMQPYGMVVDCVESGQAAIDAIRKEEAIYDAVFMDHMMPGIDGVEATRIIREEIDSQYAKTVPIIAFTANAVAGSKEFFIGKGFNAFISKPLDIFKLDEIVCAWIGPAEKEQSSPSQIHEKPPKSIGESLKSNHRAVKNTYRDGLNWHMGLEFFGSEESFYKVLRSFAANTRPLLDSIVTVNESSLSEYATIVHGIKSSSYGICADPIGRLAEALERAAKAGNLDFVVQNNQEFLDEIHRLIRHIDIILNTTEGFGTKPLKSKLDKAEALRLRDACDRYHMDEIDAVMREIEQYEYTDDKELVLWLRNSIDQLHYKQVVDKITLLVKVVEQ
jgi:signal transduction histidine kinase/DNA-binding NarL/FixJ family response regulator